MQFIEVFKFFSLFLNEFFLIDIKPANIVLGTDGFYKLCDFGEV